MKKRNIKLPIKFVTDYPHIYLLSQTQLDTWNNWLTWIARGIKICVFGIWLILIILIYKSL